VSYRCDCPSCEGGCPYPAAPFSGVETEDGLCDDCAQGSHWIDDEPALTTEATETP
jgi:hypothetical protein